MAKCRVVKAFLSMRLAKQYRMSRQYWESSYLSLSSLLLPFSLQVNPTTERGGVNEEIGSVDAVGTLQNESYQR